MARLCTQHQEQAAGRAGRDGLGEHLSGDAQRLSQFGRCDTWWLGAHHAMRRSIRSLLPDSTPQDYAYMPHVQDHNQVVREEFTRQAVAYAANPSIADPERIARLVQAVRPTSGDRVLEVATGPGYVAMGFAAVAREVVGIDLTAAPLAIAEQRRQEQGLHNVRFQLADASRLPFADGEFDVVVCCLAFHHFEQPPRMLSEMA